MARQPPCLVRGRQAGLPPALAYAGGPSPGWYGRFMGISTVVVAVKVVSRNLMKQRENLSDFRTFVMVGAFRRPRAL
jgi:hypothetical protein